MNRRIYKYLVSYTEEKTTTHKQYALHSSRGSSKSMSIFDWDRSLIDSILEIRWIYKLNTYNKTHTSAHAFSHAHAHAHNDNM